MANIYSQIHIHVVFAVQGRQNLIPFKKKEELHKYITGIVRSKNQYMLRINSVRDHVHILLSLKPDIALSDLVRDIKSSSSRFINNRGWIIGRFNWQEGFGAFSYSRSQLDRVIRYIDRQEEHHRNQMFKDEYCSLLEKFHVNFDTKYLFDWMDQPKPITYYRS